MSPNIAYTCFGKTGTFTLATRVVTTDLAGIYEYSSNLVNLSTCEPIELRLFTAVPAAHLDNVLALLAKPRQFNLTPAEADFICSMVLRHTRERFAYRICFDENSYYMSGYAPANFGPKRLGQESVSAVLAYGTRINGSDGTVFNQETGRWEKCGYIYLTGDEAKKLRLVGCSEERVIAMLGRPWKKRFFPKGAHFYGEGGVRILPGNMVYLSYWSRTGEIEIELVDGIVRAVRTDVPYVYM